MSRANRDRIYEAQRTGLRNRVRDEWHMSEELADAIVDQWDLQAASRALGRRDPRYWDEAAKWIEERFPRGRRVN
jgi:hypothetical protein